MQVQLTPQAETIVRELLAEGQYHTASEVIEVAVLRLEEEQRHAALRAAIAIGDEELARGEVVPYTPALVAEMDRNARRMVREGRTPDPDVCP